MSTKAFGEHVHVMDHPLVAHKLTIMRDKNTSVKDFRELVSEIGMLITYEATRDLPLTTKTVETPICTAEEPTLAGKKIAVVPILRAGLGLVDVFSAMLPNLEFKPGVHVNYGETVLRMKDGLPKLKDFPKEFGGSGDMVAE